MIGLLFSFLSACCLCYSTFGKRKENILKWQVANTSFVILANLFLKGYSGMATNAVCLVRNILGAKGRLTKGNTAILTVLIVIAGIAVNNRGWLGLLPVMASVEYSICMYRCKDAQQMRLALAVNVALWAIYDFAIGSYPMFATDLIVAGSSVLNVFRFKRMEECYEERDFWLKTSRIGFSKWKPDDIKLAELLWGDPDVTRLICASGYFSRDEIAARLAKEIENDMEYGVQYWPIFELSSGELIGCCGLRPHGESEYELGFHLRPKFWRQGYAVEAATAVIDHAFTALWTEELFAGHNPKNTASGKVLGKLGFHYVGDEFFEPTGLYHPSYELKRKGDQRNDD